MRDDDIKRLWGRYAVQAWWADVLPRFRAIVDAAAKEGAEEERKAILHETGSTVVKACAALARLTAPDDVDEAYVPRAAVVDIAMGIKRDMDAIRSRARSQGQGGGNG
jgi:TRAP-type C4-dicarboxylate transport system substrate-binding protein